MKIFKFGGASVKDADGVKNVAGIMAGHAGEQVLVVISAMGKMTNKFEELVSAYFNNSSETSNIVSEIRAFHYEILKNLGTENDVPLYNDVDNLLLELECLLETPNTLSDYDFVYDQIVCFGELLSSRILSNYLLQSGTRNQWIDARNFIITDSRYRDGRIQWEKTEHIISNRLKPLAEKHLVISQGFIGRDTLNSTTTLGREGSDYSAAIFAYSLKADSVTIWKDVAGVMNADPKKFSFAKLIPELTYNDCIELAYYGASVIHPKTIQPLKARGIPLYVKSFINTRDAGTSVSAAAKTLDVPCYIHKEDQIMIDLSTKDFTFIVEDTLQTVFSILARHKVRCRIMQNSAISFSFVFDNNSQHLDNMIHEFENAGLSVHKVENLELLTVYNGVKAKTEELIQGRKLWMQQTTGNTVHFVLGSPTEQ